MRTPISVGIIGYGYATATFHAPLVASASDLELAAVVTSRPAELAAAWPQVAAPATVDELLGQDDLALVVIATANDSHAALARRALAAGKHVVVDKPFTLRLAEAEELAALAARQRRVLSVFHNRRWDADFLTLRRRLVTGEGGARGEDGPLGRVVHFESHFDRHRPDVRDRWRERDGPGAGLWYDLGPHLLDQAVQLFGWPRALTLDLARQREAAQVDDWFHAVLDYGPMRAILHAGMVAAQVGPRFVLHGLRGSAEKRGLDPQEDALRAGRRPAGDARADWGADPLAFEVVTVGARGGQERLSRQLPAERGDYLAFYDGVAAAIRGEGPNPVPPDEAVAVMALLERGLESAARGCTLACAPPEPA
jgi:predicted dehydrogenase